MTDLPLLHVGVSGDIEDVMVMARVQKLKEEPLGLPAVVTTVIFKSSLDTLPNSVGK